MTKASSRRPVILVADAHDRLRDELLRRLKESMPGWDVLPAADGEAILLLDQEYQADAVLMDIVLPGIGGLEVIERLKKRRPAVKIVVFSLHAGLHFQERALEVGASAFIGKEKPFSEILDALKSVLSLG
jgi:two-component system invasion response regulator UvrY